VKVKGKVVMMDDVLVNSTQSIVASKEVETAAELQVPRLKIQLAVGITQMTRYRYIVS
jgi:hypothetical protein